MVSMSIVEVITQGFILVTGVAGQLLVAHKNTLGFWVWITSNIVLIVVSANQGMMGMVALYIFYSFMCGYSIWKWNKDKAAGRG